MHYIPIHTNMHYKQDEDEFREEIGRRVQRRVSSVHGGNEFFK